MTDPAATRAGRAKSRSKKLCKFVHYCAVSLQDVYHSKCAIFGHIKTATKVSLSLSMWLHDIASSLYVYGRRDSLPQQIWGRWLTTVKPSPC
ncbi:hypothetical protein FQ038_19225 [Escherichia coli]|nr:hypothetical protein [Escherichia coli]